MKIMVVGSSGYIGRNVVQDGSLRRPGQARHVHGHRPVADGTRNRGHREEVLCRTLRSPSAKAPGCRPGNFDNSRAVNEFDWKIQSVGKMVLDEINGTREQAGLARVDTG